MPRERVNPVISGLATVVIVTIVFVAVIISGLPGGPQLPLIGSSDKTIKAQLVDADGLAPHASVEIAGIKIGEVLKVEGSGNTAIATMAIQPQYTDIHSDATVQLRPHGLFGPKFLQLTPGTSTAPQLGDGQLIPGVATNQPVDLDQVLHELQAPQRTELQTIFVELANAGQGRGDDVNHLLSVSRNLTSLLQEPVQSLNTVAPNLSNMLVQNESFNAAFAQAPLDQLLNKLNGSLGALARNSDSLSSVLTHANSSLNQLDQAISGESGNLRSTIEQLPALMDQFNRFNDLLSLFAANLTGKEPGTSTAVPGIIGAIENVRSAFSSYTPCTPNVKGCPADGRAYFARVQVFNLAPNSPLPCSLNQLPTSVLQKLGITGGLNLPCNTAKAASATVPAGASTGPAAALGFDPSALAGLLQS